MRTLLLWAVGTTDSFFMNRFTKTSGRAGFLDSRRLSFFPSVKETKETVSEWLAKCFLALATYCHRPNFDMIRNVFDLGDVSGH